MICYNHTHIREIRYTPLLVKGADCIGIYKSNYYVITTTTRFLLSYYSVCMECICIILLSFILISFRFFQYGDVSEINKFELIDNYSGITCYVYDTYMVGIHSSGTWAGFKLTPLVVKGADCIGSYKSNYYVITTTTRFLFSYYSVCMECICIILLSFILISFRFFRTIGKTCLNWPPWYSWNVVESDVKHHSPIMKYIWFATTTHTYVKLDICVIITITWLVPLLGGLLILLGINILFIFF
jgi:hypothetical protein